MRKVRGGLVPAQDANTDAFDALQHGEVVKVTIVTYRTRNSRFHRKFFAMLNVLHGYVSEVMPFEVFRSWITVQAGYFETGPRGFVCAKSIAFSRMGPDEFEQLYNRVIDFALSDFLPTVCSRESVDAEAMRLIEGF